MRFVEDSAAAGNAGRDGSAGRAAPREAMGDSTATGWVTSPFGSPLGLIGHAAGDLEAKVAEQQTRVIHLQGIIPIDGADVDVPATVVRAGAWAMVETLEEALGAVVTRAEVTGPHGHRIRWGDQLEVHPMTARTPGKNLSGDAVEGYLATDACGRLAEWAQLVGEGIAESRRCAAKARWEQQADQTDREDVG